MAGAEGGDGSRGAPYGAFSELPWATVTTGTTIAVGRGTYDEDLPVLPDRTTLRGACVTETILTNSIRDTSGGRGVVTVTNGTLTLASLRIANPSRPGVVVSGARGSLVLEGVWIERAAIIGMVAVGGSVTANGLVIASTHAEPPDAPSARGVTAQDGAAVELSRTVLIDNDGFGIEVGLGEARLTLRDSVVRDMQTTVGTEGWGLAAVQTAQVVVERSVIQSVFDVGVFAQAAGTQVTIVDSVIRDVAPQPRTGIDGWGVGVDIDARFEATRLLIERTTSDAVMVREGAHAELADVVIRNTDPLGIAIEDLFEGTGAQAGGACLDIQSGSANVAGMVALDCQSFGVHVAGGGRLTASDLLVRGVRSHPEHGRFGRGIGAESGAEITLTRAVIAESREVGVMAAVDGRIVASDIVVENTLPNSCGETGDCDSGFGMGIGAYYDSIITVTNFLQRGATLCGAQVAFGSSLDLSMGEVVGNDIGACVQVDGYDPMRLSNDVAYRDNGTNIVATTLPVPEPLEGI